MDIKIKKIVIKIVAVVVYIGLIVVLFFTGRTHLVLLDNKSDPNGAYKAERFITVTVDKTEPLEFSRNIRDKVTIKGQTLALKIEFIDGREPINKKIKVPLSQDSILVSLPKIIAGIDPAFEPFDLYADKKPITTADRKGDLEEN